MKKFFPVEILAAEPYSSIIGYPSATKRQIQSRIVELKELGVDSVSFQGPLLIGKIPVLGKGYTGVVILAKRDGKKVALKIRRTDSPRKTMKDESALLKKANSVKVGPLLVDSSNNFLIMQYLNGKKIYDWNSQEKIAQTTVQGWMKSPGHRKNILTPYFKSEGIGIVVSPDDKVYITQNFC